MTRTPTRPADRSTNPQRGADHLGAPDAGAELPSSDSARRPGASTHPWAWWVWAIGAEAAASTTNNPLMLLLLLTAVITVVLNRRGKPVTGGTA